MKNLFKLMLLFILAIPFQGCSDDDSSSSSNLPVTYYSIKGVWKLQEWSGAGEELPVVYLEFFSGKEKKCNIYTKGLSTMYPDVVSGIYELEDDYYKGDIITGKYDNGKDTGKWSNDYIITLFKEDVMVWVVDGNKSDSYTYVRVDAVPEDMKYIP